MTDSAHIATHLRGSLAREGLKARGIERVARNPDCDRLAALTLASVSPATYAEVVLGESVSDARSPLALAAGHHFESKLLAENASGLVALYVAAGRLPPQGVTVVDLSRAGNTRREEGREKVRAATRALITRALAGEAVPEVVLKPRMVLTVAGSPHEVEPDALVWTEGFYRVVEIKAYPDRGGRTDPDDLRNACRQAAVGVVALRALVAELGHTNSCTRIPAAGDLVFQRPGSSEGRLHPMTLAGEVDSLQRLLAGLPARLAEIVAKTQGASIDDPAVLLALPKRWQAGCATTCALAGRCRGEMSACADPALLGEAARESLAGVGSVVIALDLVRGKRAPANESEHALVEHLQPALGQLRKAVGHVG